MTRNLLLSALILFPFWIIAQPNPTIRSFRAEKLYLDGLKKFQQRQFYDAIETFDKVVELNDEHPNVYEARGDAYYQLKEFDKALYDYEEAIKLDRDNANLWNNAGVAAGDLQMYRAAANYFFEAIQIEPEHADANDNYLEARRLMESEGIAYNEPDRSRPWEDDRDYWDRDRNRDRDGDRDYGSSSGNSGGRDSWDDDRDRDRDDDYWDRDRNDDRDSDYWDRDRDDRDRDNNTRPSKYNPTRPGQDRDRNRDEDFDDDSRNENREYTYKNTQINVGPRTDIQLKVDQVRITKNSTMLTFTLKNLSDKSFPVKLASRKSKEAWYLTDRSFDKIYRLKSIKNLEGWNQGNAYNLKPRASKLFLAEFDRIDDNIFFFHLLEGKINKPGAWNIYDIELSRK